MSGRHSKPATSSVTVAKIAVAGAVLVQCSAHGAVQPARVRGNTVEWGAPHRRVAPGQSVVFYDVDDEIVVGSAFAAK